MIINPAQQVHDEKEVNAIKEVAESGWWSEGIRATKFKTKLAKYLNRRFVMLTNSGSSANLAALTALTTRYIPEDRRLMEGDEIITPALCFPTTVSPIYHARCVPVFVDVEPTTWNVDIDQVEQAITPKTKAVIAAVNLGSPYDLERLSELCKKYNLWLIVDNCDGLSSTYNGKQTGSYGDIATSSFYPAHHISCGEGGAVYTDNPHIFRALRSIINWGRDCWCEPNKDNTCGRRYCWELGNLPYGYDHKNTYAEMGFNLKMTDLQAAIGIEQLDKLPTFAQARKDNHTFLRDVFEPYQKWFDIPKQLEKADSSWFGYVIKLKEGTPFTKQDMIDYLDKEGVKSRAFFCGNILKQPVITDGNIKYRALNDCPNSTDMMLNSFWIGVHPAIKEEQRQYMQEVVLKFLNQYV